MTQDEEKIIILLLSCLAIFLAVLLAQRFLGVQETRKAFFENVNNATLQVKD